MSQQFSNTTVRDPRLGELQWREIKNKWGKTSWVMDRKDAPNWFVQLFVQNADNEGRLFEQEGVYYYKMTSDSIFKNKKSTRSTTSGTSIVTSTAIAPGAGGTGYSNEGAKKGHEENVQMHKEFLAKMDDVIFSLGAVKDALEIVAKKLERIQ